MAQGKGDPNDQLNPIAIMCVVVLVAWLVWITKHEAISAAVLYVRGIELWFLTLVFPELGQLKQWVDRIPRHMVTFGDLNQVSSIVGGYLRWIFAPAIMGCALWVMLGSKRDKFKTKYTEKTLAIAESVNWAHTKLFTRLNLSDMDIDSGPWAASKTELMFIKEYRLRNPDGSIDKERTTAVLERQLGPLWTRYEGIKSPLRRAMFALFCARIAGTQPEKPKQAGKNPVQYRAELNKVQATASEALAVANRMVDRFALNAAEDKYDFSGVDEIFLKYGRHKIIAGVCTKHAYELCVLISMYEEAKKVMPLPPNWFRWLKGKDRTLWYALHNNGMRVPFVEVCGIDAHRKAELAIGRAMEMPIVKKAVDGIEIAIAQYADDQDGLDEADIAKEFDYSKVGIAFAQSRAVPKPGQTQEQADAEQKANQEALAAKAQEESVASTADDGQDSKNHNGKE